MRMLKSRSLITKKRLKKSKRLRQNSMMKRKNQDMKMTMVLLTLIIMNPSPED
jgi:hypothetical protein